MRAIIPQGYEHLRDSRLRFLARFSGWCAAGVLNPRLDCRAVRLTPLRGAYYAVGVAQEHVPFRVRKIKETANVSLTRFDHPAGARLPDSEEQAADRFQINIVERGAFRLGHKGREWLLGAGCVFLSRPKDVYRYAHLKDVEPDTCLSVTLSRSLSRELLPRVNSLPLVPQVSNRLRFLQLELASIVQDDIPLGLETLACEFVEAVEEASTGDRHLYRPNQFNWYAERIHAARQRIDANPADQHSLLQLSSLVAMSPFLFARVFRELIGMPPHRYLVQLRLARARTLLKSGMSVTNTCYAAGFNNLSHFIRTFRRHFGFVPSAMKHLRWEQ
jgi:AraC-like DNA-binding protein